MTFDEDELRILWEALSQWIENTDEPENGQPETEQMRIARAMQERFDARYAADSLLSGPVYDPAERCRHCGHARGNHYNARKSAHRIKRTPCHHLGKNDMRCDCRCFIEPKTHQEWNQ